jgi:hypothetical protein
MSSTNSTSRPRTSSTMSRTTRTLPLVSVPVP